MGYPRKIVTCCYCGTRAALVLDKGRHELVCSNCGAPLHDLKMIPKAAKGDKELVKATREFKVSPKKTKKKKRKGLFRDILEEAFDIFEDILD